MANQEHLDILKQGVKVWNLWRGEHADIQPDLSGVDLSGIDHIDVEAIRMILCYDIRTAISLADSINIKINLREINLSRTDLSRANLQKASLHWANLRQANLRQANLHQANLHQANLRE